MLDYIKQNLGFGYLTPEKAQKSLDGSQAQCSFEFNAIEDCAKLVKIFEKYPLRSKKRFEFSIWQEFVQAVQCGESASEHVRQLVKKLEDIREYKPEIASAYYSTHSKGPSVSRRREPLLDQTKDYELDAAFGFWLGGFTDAEGSLRTLGQKTKRPYPGFRIILRDDDIEVLDYIKQNLGFGYLTPKKAHQHPTHTSKPQCGFEFNAIKDCAKLVKIFEQYPLRSKKRFEFPVWQEFVQAVQCGEGASEHVRQLVKKLEDIRKYKSEIASAYYSIHPKAPRVSTQRDHQETFA